MTTTFLDLGVTGVQRYLARTTDLKGRRGASAWLSRATDREEVAQWIAQHDRLAAWGVEVNRDAGVADGVVPLRMPVGTDADAVASAVFVRIRDLLPGVEMRASWGPGDSYIEAYQAWTCKPDPASSRTSPPASGDFPPLESCGKCRVDPALERTEIHGEWFWLCADCRKRYKDLHRWQGLADGKVPVTAEYDMLRRLSRDQSTVAGDFEDLAKLGDEHSNANHLATVFADGNRIGALFDRVIAGGDRQAKAEASRALADATRYALDAATKTVLGDDPDAVVPVIPHVVGGDDLLVSVVADRAWRFVTAYLREFSGRLTTDATLSRYAAEDGSVPGASAGVVFAHCSHPFGRSVELAEDLLTQAKRAHAGRVPTALWLDVTREGDQVPQGRTAWTLDALLTEDAAIRTLRTVDPSGRAALERLVDPADAVLSAARLREYARRLDRGGELEPFLNGDAPTARVADALALARWWR